MTDTFDLSRFVDAQVQFYAQALRELRQGRKESHWMWFVFPQIEGLGTSPTARQFAIKSVEEATAYASHPILGPRLQECCEALLAINGSSANSILGSPDDLKLRSSMTLFLHVAGPDSVFAKVLEKFFFGGSDPRTVNLISSGT